MTTETTSVSGATESTAAPAVDATTGLATQTDASTEQTNEPNPETEKERESRNAQRRIDTLVRTRTEARTEAQIARREAEQLRAQLEQVRAGNREPANEEPQREDIEKLVTRRAEELATVAAVSQRANEIVKAGTKAFGEDFRERAIAVMDEAGPMYQPNGLPTALGEAIHDAENPAALLHHLGQNPDIAESLRGLTAAQLGRRVARIEAEMKPAEPKPSNAPKPPNRPSGGGGTGEVSAESDAFMAHKLKQLRGR